MSAGGALISKDLVTMRKLLDNVEFNEHQWNPKLTTQSSQRDERAEIKTHFEMLAKQQLPTVSEIQNANIIDELSDSFSVENLQRQVYPQSSTKAKKTKTKQQVQSMNLRSGT